jgi:hypothetical protein
MNENYNTETSEAFPSESSESPHWHGEPPPVPPNAFPSYMRPPGGFTSSANQHEIAARGFANIFALNPILAFFAIVVDAMVSAIDVSTLEITAPVLWLISAVVVGVVVYRGQMKFAGDDSETSLLKSLMVGFLVALPTPFPAFLTVPSAIAGTVQILRNRK